MANLNDGFVKFDPNLPESHQPYATFAPSREMKSGGMFKQHRTRAAALSAVANNSFRVKLYEWDESAGRWNELAVFDAHNKPDTCDSCPVRFMTRAEWDDAVRQARAGGRSTHQLGLRYFYGCNNGYQAFDRDHGGKLVWPPSVVTVCVSCMTRRRLK